MNKFVLLLGLFLLSACGSGTYVQEFNVGTQGVVVEFYEGYPDTEVYEKEPLPIVLRVANEGAYDVPSDRFSLSWAFDPLYINAPERSHSAFVEQNFDTVFSSSFENPKAQSTLLASPLHGRSPTYPQGEEITIEEYEIATNAIVGSRQNPTTQLSAMICYEYKTVLARGVCVDVDDYLRTGREQACEGQDYSLGSQGAPVAFTTLETRTKPINTGDSFRLARPEFIVTLRNVGGGIIVSPPKSDFGQACSLQGLSSEELGAVKVNGTIFGIALECSPEVVRFRNDVAKTRCTVPDESLNNPALAIGQNIMTVLELQASYVYRSSLSADIEIIADPVETAGGFSENSPPLQGYVYDSDGDVVIDRNTGRPQIRCDVETSGFYSPNETEWSCACGQKQCSEMDSVDGTSFCTYGLCPANSYCCNKEAYENYKNPRGSR